MPHPLPEHPIIPLGEAPYTVPLHLTLVEPGRFLMGEGKEAHEISLTNHFYIGTFPITQVQWSAVFPDHTPSRFKGPNLPVERVSWHDIVDGTQKNGPPEAFLARINRQLTELPEWNGYAFRLPTEAEWEYAAKGGHLASQDFKRGAETAKLYSEYAGGDVLDLVGWFEDNNNVGTHPVGRKQANQLGLYDLSGNVWEWCADVFDGQIYGDRVGQETKDPPVVEMTEYRPGRVLRGGSWVGSARPCRLSFRGHGGPRYRYSRFGFRLILAPVQAGE